MNKEDILAYEEMVVSLIRDLKDSFTRNADPENALDGLEREIFDRLSPESQKEFTGIIRQVFDLQARGVDPEYHNDTIVRVVQFCGGEYLNLPDKIMREGFELARAMKKLEETPFPDMPRNRLC